MQGLQGSADELMQELKAVKAANLELETRAICTQQKLEAAQRTAAESFVNMATKHVRLSSCVDQNFVQTSLLLCCPIEQCMSPQVASPTG